MIKMQSLLTSQRMTWFHSGPRTRANIQCVVLGVSQTRVSQVTASGQFPSDRFYREVSVSPASALCACEGSGAGAAQSLQLGFALMQRIYSMESCPCFKQRNGTSFRQQHDPWSKAAVFKKVGRGITTLALQIGQGYIHIRTSLHFIPNENDP